MGYTLCVLGCGTMGVAILSGVLTSLERKSRPASSPLSAWESHTTGTTTPIYTPGAYIPSRFIACVGRRESEVKLRKTLDEISPLTRGVEIMSGGNLTAVKQADVVLLCCKPQLVSSVLSESGLLQALDGKLLVSIVAGVKINQLSKFLQGSTRIVRAMPNTPCKIREGMTVVSTLPTSASADSDRQIILNIFSSIGRCRFLDEKYFDACTALSGSGPAFACVFLEAMADGGVMMGLPRAEALELAAQTLQGAARMALQPQVHPAQIKDSVTTPGGCTIAGLLALEDGKVRSTIARAIQIATERASELGKTVE